MYNLILVDDEETILEGLETMVPWETLGFRLSRTFTGAQKAIDYCLTHQVDVVLTDIRMPFVSGLQLIEQLKESCPTAPPLFCIMSAYSEFSYAQQAITLGAKSYLLKPASLAEISEVFTNICNQLDGNIICPVSNYNEQFNPLVQKSLAIIHKRTNGCSLKLISEELGVNISYLSRLFKEETGKNFLEYIHTVKMETASRMLLSPQAYKNSDIARALGYQDAQNFIRTFKHSFGMTPQKYAKSNKPNGK
ncbi:MAG: helix-turn-helix domain-containing protein [Sphaerochaeta sp.]